MLPNKVKNRFQSLLDIELGERKKEVSCEISQVQEKMVGRGLLNSSVTINHTRGVCENELKIRSDIIWHQFLRTINSCTLSADSFETEDIKKVISEKIFDEFLKLQNIFITESHKLGGNSQGLEHLIELKERLVKKYSTEIEIMMDAKEKHDAGPNQPTLNIQGNVGAIQIGNYASAEFTQSWGNDQIGEVVMVLQEIQDTVKAADYLQKKHKNDLIEAIKESQQELKKDKPNGIKTKSLLTGILEAIKHINSAHVLYEKFAELLQRLGLQVIF